MFGSSFFSTTPPPPPAPPACHALLKHALAHTHTYTSSVDVGLGGGRWNKPAAAPQKNLGRLEAGEGGHGRQGPQTFYRLARDFSALPLCLTCHTLPPCPTSPHPHPLSPPPSNIYLLYNAIYILLCVVFKENRVFYT